MLVAFPLRCALVHAETGSDWDRKLRILVGPLLDRGPSVSHREVRSDWREPWKTW